MKMKLTESLCVSGRLVRPFFAHTNKKPAQHDHLEGEQEDNLRKPLQGTFSPEGVMVAKKDFNAPKHEDLDVPNLEVIKAMQSLTSKNLWYYYTCTPEGVEYLREWLHLPQEIVPSTYKKQARPQRPAQARDWGDRDDYRRRDKAEGAPGEFRPQFAGVGRGAPRE
ncbi:Plectin/S10 domain-containing protein [Phellopilus nigrolimitatus]|nr:Plectin/S10 domain-containing protein [Phellopilus nigrolimitatus]